MSKLLHDTGEALYGPRWQSNIARDLGVSVRAVQYWASGAIDMPASAARDLTRICEERIAGIESAVDGLRAASTPKG